MREGYTLVAVGWEPTPNTRALSLYPPVATDGGRPITGEVTNWFIPLEPSRSFDLTSSYWTGFEEYPPLRPDDPSYRLTERLGYHGEERVIPRESWEFGRLVDGAMVQDPSQLYLWTGFRPGYTYQLTYESSNPQVIGVGFAAIRDAAAYFKFDPDAEVRGEYAYAYGVSQTGRYLRQLIHEGFTVDETGERRALDGVFVHAGGSSLGPFNTRFGHPNDGGFHSQTKFPIRYTETEDLATGRVEGLGSRIPEGLEPKVVLYETSSEYWDRGRVAALNHTTIDGREDVELAENVRFYVMASIPHSNGSLPPVGGVGPAGTKEPDRCAAVDAGAPCGARPLGAGRRAAAPQPAPDVRGRHADRAERAQVPGDPGRPVAVSCAGRLPVRPPGRAH